MPTPPTSLRDYFANPLNQEENEARRQHVVERAKERAEIDMLPEQVNDVERRISKSRKLIAEGKTPSPILPQLLWTRTKANKEHWKVLIHGKPVVFAVCPIRGVVSVEREDMKAKREAKK